MLGPARSRYLRIGPPAAITTATVLARRLGGRWCEQPGRRGGPRPSKVPEIEPARATTARAIRPHHPAASSRIAHLAAATVYSFGRGYSVSQRRRFMGPYQHHAPSILDGPCSGRWCPSSSFGSCRSISLVALARLRRGRSGSWPGLYSRSFLVTRNMSLRSAVNMYGFWWSFHITWRS